MKKIIVMLCLAALITIPAMNAYPATITYTDTGHGSGTLNGTPFSDADFTISATGDTTNRQSIGPVFFIDNDSASIDIAGLGTLTFTTATRFFVNNLDDIVGFSRAGSAGSDLYNGPVDSAFSTWDMLSSIGPITGDASLLQWDPLTYGAVQTSGGTLIFDSGISAATFQATVGAVPEPSTFLLFGAGLAGLGILRRRFKK